MDFFKNYGKLLIALGTGLGTAIIIVLKALGIKLTM